ncbi:MAG: methyltransferase type 11 [uncultured bacterium]|uniref:Methyltransferase type 11 n=1 Tax=Candidatus Nomurabacteria bacterium GW2011_GWA1_46_11 TaxID=1618732 RepID=A0A0G1QX44_9BACT|nr:MAG: methyltransferase type 11 [uncultured bacterium]KKT78323.1 MAG: Methyltransferase type 11 [Microgenomates group bacterium GW2011_GWB1_44_8]KKU22383.1 MAG: Methyltransferase type 11 [Candidatus Nomurabacteria bacterium GW2011_GWA1_46_11]
MSVIHWLRTNRLTRQVVYSLGTVILKDIYHRIKHYLYKNEKILDIGAGTCNLDEILLKNGFEVTPLDIVNLSFVDGIEPVIYDGRQIPYKDGEFGIALLFYVLHHVPEPEKLLLQAKRVAKKILIREEIYTSPLQRNLMFLEDSLLNLQFFHHPHANKSDVQWRQTFRKLGLKLVEVKIEPHLWIFTKGTYLLTT